MPSYNDDPTNFEEFADYLNLANDSEDEYDAMTPTPKMERIEEEPRASAIPSPPPSSGGDPIDEDDEDDLYAEIPADPVWNNRRENSSSDGQVNPQWLLSGDAPRPTASNMSELQPHHPSPADSDDTSNASPLGDRRSALESIQERNEALVVKPGAPPKSSKSFSLLPEILKLKNGEDEDEKILASDEGKRLTSKERRQLRNKVSARNFRVRRKEYIVHLENLVESQTQEIESLRQSLSQCQLENNTLRQDSAFLRSIVSNQPNAGQTSQGEAMPMPNKDVNPNTYEWPLAYDGSQSPTQSSSNKFNDRSMFNGHIHAYGVRVPEVQFDKTHANGMAPPLPPAPNSPYTPPNDASKAPSQIPLPPGVENLGYPGMLQAITYLYDYLVKAGTPAMIPQSPQQQPVSGFPLSQPQYNPQSQQWGDGKLIGAPAYGFNPYYNGNWGWGGPPGPAV